MSEEIVDKKKVSPEVKAKIDSFIEMWSNYGPDPKRAGSIAGKKTAGSNSIINAPGNRTDLIPLINERLEKQAGRGRPKLLKETVEKPEKISVDIEGLDMRALQQALKPRLTKYIPCDPTPKQTAFLVMNNIKEVLYGGDVALDTSLLTTDGWKTMGTVEVGDYVYTEMGTPTKITWKSDVMHNVCYKITFNRNKSTEIVIAGEGHLWDVHNMVELTIETKNTRQIYEKFSSNMYAIPVVTMPRGQHKDWHYISNIELVETVPTQCIEVENPTHLYLLTTKLIITHNSAGGGKSIAQLMAALQFVDIPGYSAILFRKTYSDLSLPGALISVAKEWLAPFTEKKEVHWSDKEKKFTFPSGATLAFGYLESSNDCYRYQGAEFQYIGFDECTHISPENYRYLFSRLRKSISLSVPLRFRATCNPGGEYGEYYYDRFFKEGKEKGRIFIQAGISDNPYIDAVQYKEALSELDPITRAQLEDGNWEIKQSGNMFDRKWFLTVPSIHLPASRQFVRFWDMASTDPSKRKKRSDKRAPDWTVGMKLSTHLGLYWIEDIARVQKTPSESEKLIIQCAEMDGYKCAIRMEQEPGSSGAIAIDNYARKVLDGYNFAGIASTGSKVQRAEAVSAAAEAGRIMITENCRNKLEFFDEAEVFPYGIKDDMVDTLSGGFNFFRKPCILAAPTSSHKAGGSYWSKI